MRYIRRSLSPKHTSPRRPISFSLFLSLFYYTNIYIYTYRRTTKTTTRPNPLLMRRAARIHVARGAPLTAFCVTLRLKERKRGTRDKIGSHVTQKIERERERKKKKISPSSFSFKRNARNTKSHTLTQTDDAFLRELLETTRCLSGSKPEADKVQAIFLL